jgi:hypothetical protein
VPPPLGRGTFVYRAFEPMPVARVITYEDSEISKPLVKITKLVSSRTKPENLTSSQVALTSILGSITSQIGVDVGQVHTPTPQALNLRNPMQAERSDAQLGGSNPFSHHYSGRS